LQWPVLNRNKVGVSACTRHKSSFLSSGKNGFVGCSLRVTLVLGIPNVIKVVAQMLAYVCTAHAGVNGFESNLADVLVSVIGCSH